MAKEATTQNEILSFMKKGKTYKAEEIAGGIGKQKANVYQALVRLLVAGKVIKIVNLENSRDVSWGLA